MFALARLEAVEFAALILGDIAVCSFMWSLQVLRQFYCVVSALQVLRQFYCVASALQVIIQLYCVAFVLCSYCYLTQFQARKGELVAKYTTLSGYVADLHRVYPLCKIILVVIGMDIYYR